MFFRKKDPKTEFWNWFVKNKSKIEGFIDTKHSDYSIFQELTKRIKKFSPLLFAEVTKNTNSEYVLIITPDGIKDGIHPTQELYDAAPPIENWVITKFRQPGAVSHLQFKELDFTYDDIRIWRIFEVENELVDIAILIKGYQDEDDRYKALAFLYLDRHVGEFNVMTRIRHIDFLGWDQRMEEFEEIDLVTLKEEIAAKLY